MQGEVQVLQGGFCGGSVPGFLRRILLGFCEDSAQSENAVQAREKASWRRREVQFQGATGLPRRRFRGAKPRHAISAPQERSRLAGFREDPDLPQGMIAWYCGASREKSKLAPMGSSIPGRHRLAPPPHQRPQTCSLLAPCRFCMIQFYL